jgi:hypothetical protein
MQRLRWLLHGCAEWTVLHMQPACDMHVCKPWRVPLKGCDLKS